MDEVAETLDFLRFAHHCDAPYTGVVMFVLKEGDDRHQVRSVEIRNGAVRILDKAHPSPSCVVRCGRDTFLGVYSGDLHPHTAILGGRLHVDGFNYGELRRFLTSFDFSSAKWRQFYQEREAARSSATAVSLDSVLASWRSMLVPMAHAHSSSKSLHLSRRILTQNTVCVAIDDGGVVPAAPRSPVTAPSSVTFKSHRVGALFLALEALVRHPALVPAREHADFMHRLL